MDNDGLDAGLIREAGTSGDTLYPILHEEDARPRPAVPAARRDGIRGPRRAHRDDGRGGGTPSGRAARALLLARGQAFLLEERAGRLTVAAYGARQGRLARSYDLRPLALPPWASLAERREGRQWTVFKVAARIEGDTLEFRYDATRHQAFGFRPPGVVEQIQGVACVALDSGRVALRPGPGSSPPPISGPAPPIPGARLVSVHARRADATIVLGGPPANVDGALLDGSRRSIFELSPDSRTVIVHRFVEPGGSRLPPIRLEHGHRTDAIWATLDRRHVLLRRADD
jgi:hypothetical protein